MVSQDALLAARLVARDDGAIGEAFDRFAPAVYASVRPILGDSAAAQDVVQDVFVALWSRPERYDAQRGPLAAFLAVSARRRAIDVVRSEGRRCAREQRHHRLAAASVAPDAAEALAVTDLVRAAVRMLPPAQRQVVELAYFHGLRYRDVAAALGIPEGTAKSRLRLALAKLEAALPAEAVGRGRQRR